jgi:hypothetical protein
VTVILVLAMLVMFFVAEKFTHKPASEYIHSTSPGTEAAAGKVQPIVAGSQVPEPPYLYQVRTGTDRRQTNRPARRSLPAA